MSDPRDQDTSRFEQPNLVNRLIEIETQLAHQQWICDQLNEVVVDQSQKMLKLERSILQLQNQLKEVHRGAQEPRDLREEIPPHY